MTARGHNHRASLIAEQRYRCIWCSCKISSSLPVGHPRKATLEHIKPRSEGGGSNRENLAAACLQCNTTRKSQRPDPGGHVHAARQRAERFAQLFAKKPLDVENSRA